MRSKLLYALAHASSPPAFGVDPVELYALCDALQVQRDCLTPVNDGTLGVTFLARAPGGDIFIKSYSMPDGQKSLERETDFLRRIYGARLNARLLSVEGLDQPRNWLIMRQLLPCSPDVTPNRVRMLIGDYQAALDSSSGPGVDVSGLSDFADILRHARDGVEHLSRRGKLNPTRRTELLLAIDEVDQETEGVAACVCHGDLGPKNIMARNGNLFAIDWEDAFLGVPGYDYLYWLTFLCNQKFYATPDVLGVTPLGRDVERALMAIIVVLKAYIANLMGADALHQITVEERLREVIAIG